MPDLATLAVLLPLWQQQLGHQVCQALVGIRLAQQQQQHMVRMFVAGLSCHPYRSLQTMI